MSPPTDVVFDHGAVYPETASLRSAVTRRDWPACRAVLDAADPARRTALISIVAEADDLEPFLRAALAENPADGTASAVLGDHLIEVGWRIRTGAPAKYVSEDQFTRFRDHLCRAEQVLIDGAVHNPKDPAIWTSRLISARGLSLGLAETRRRYDRMTAAHRGHLPGQRQMLQSLCPKWNGTWEQAHQFAREATEGEPPGSPHALLIAEAHIEHALDSADDHSGMVTYLAQPHVRAEIYQAAQRSVGHPDFTVGYGWLAALNNFAMCFTLLGDRGAAATAFGQLGGFASDDPWRYLGDGPTEFRKSRAWALGGHR